MIDGFDIDRIVKLIASHDALSPRDRVLFEDYLETFTLSDSPQPPVDESVLKTMRDRITEMLANKSLRVALAPEALAPAEDGGEQDEEAAMGPAFMDRKKVRKKKGVPL